MELCCSILSYIVLIFVLCSLCSVPNYLQYLAMAPTIQLGSCFTTWKDLDEALQAHAVQQQVPYGILCSEFVEPYNKKHDKNIPTHLKYASLTYACIHAGKPRSKGTGLRGNQRYVFLSPHQILFLKTFHHWLPVFVICSTFKKNCPARIRARVDETRNQFSVTVYSVDHNHEINPEYSDCYPLNRRLTKEEEAQASNLIDLEVRPSILQNVIRTSTGKCPTLQDVRNAK